MATVLRAGELRALERVGIDLKAKTVTVREPEPAE